MNHLEKKRQLEHIIDECLLPLIDNDYALFGLPYYNNVGDILIWNGELEFLKKTPHKCVATCALNSYPTTPLPENVVILITGGGYFGDLWRNSWESVLRRIEINRNNKIIFLPNTIYYQDPALLEKDSRFLSTFPNLTICARDKVSFELAKKSFSNKVILVPDMAFCMSEKYLSRWAGRKPSKKALLFKRRDKESPDTKLAIEEAAFDIHDWAPMEQASKAELNFHRLLARTPLLRRISADAAEKSVTWLYKNLYRRILTRDGIRQLSAYEKIYTTRLHAMILGCMLGRDIRLIDNKFGKLSAYYDTWLSDCDNVTYHKAK